MGELATRLSRGDTRVVTGPDLLAFVAGRRWFGGRSQGPIDARVVESVPVPGDPPVAVALAEVEYAAGTTDRYQLVLSARDASGPVPIANLAGAELYDAMDDASAAPVMARALRDGATFTGPGGAEVRFAHVAGEDFDPGAPARPLGADMTNTAVVIGDDVLLKAYRRLTAGPNPELEVLRFLGERGFPHVPPLVGWYEREGGAVDTTLGVAVRFMRGACDGFTMVLDALGTDPASAVPRLHRLGEVTALLHATLASDPSDPTFAPEDPSAESVALIRASLDDEIATVFAGLPDTPELAPLAARGTEVREMLRGIDPTGDLGRRIRQHGDMHLGQALWHGGDWVIVDFEGEPARGTGERRLKGLPLRDVAGALRSISYAAWVARLDRGTDVPAAWERAAREAFLDGYLTAVHGRGLLPPARETVRDLLALFELEKATYELRYEVDHRPEWARIPAAGITALLAGDTR